MNIVYWIVLGVAAILLLIGTFADLQIAKIVHNPNNAFGDFFAAAVMWFICILMPMATGLMFGVLLKNFQKLGILLRITCPILLIFGVYASIGKVAEFYGSNQLYGTPFKWIVYVAVSTFMLAAVLSAYVSRKYTKAVLTVAIAGVISIAGGHMLIDTFKDMWGRQQFLTMDNPTAQFTVWYEPQFPSSEKMNEMGDKIKSFPSEHSFVAISILWLSMFVNFLGFCQNNRKIWINGIIVFALCFWVCTAASIMMSGKHFLSDVSMSAIIFLLVFIVSSAIFNDNFRIRSNVRKAENQAKKKEKTENIVGE